MAAETHFLTVFIEGYQSCLKISLPRKKSWFFPLFQVTSFSGDSEESEERHITPLAEYQRLN